MTCTCCLAVAIGAVIAMLLSGWFCFWWGRWLEQRTHIERLERELGLSPGEAPR